MLKLKSLISQLENSGKKASCRMNQAEDKMSGLDDIVYAYFFVPRSHEV